MAKTRQIGAIVEALIGMKDQFYSNLSLNQMEALDDACNLLSKNFGDFTKYNYDCTIIGKKVVSFTPDSNTH